MSEEKFLFTIPANGSVPVNATGNRVYCESATGVFFLNVPGTATYEMKAKRTRVLSQPLKTFALENRTATPIDVELHIGSDIIQDNEFQIAGTITGDVKVVNPAGQKLSVEDTQAISKQEQIRAAAAGTATRIDTLIAEAKDGKSLRAPLTSLQGASYAEALGTTVVAVTATANVNGVIIRHGAYQSWNAGQAGIRLGSNQYLTPRNMGVSGPYMFGTINNIRIPAGVSVELHSGNTLCPVSIFYEVL